ncbi:FAD-dependent monooxygenase [Pseudomonas asuensis]|uniref:FAD-dependent monooxygenase n=1 Tax=Pseudomonas asuensis TaxID=1825787 RepID=A0ABQ2GXS4_9PSED|nr:FAD-dependent monooxygenase [Pseudomonas asuensis]GGM16314.1 hypothetical protein GCM10009425_29070 [Pseudomonas asuensis]
MSGTSSRVTNSHSAAVIGGSLGGLFAANMLRSAGWEVEVFERSLHDLDSRGGGIVLQPSVIDVLRRSGCSLPAESLGVASRYRIVFRPDGSVQSHHYAPQIQTSWSLIYTTLRNAFGLEHYHRGYTLNDIKMISPNRVDALFDNGASVEADLLIGADGGGSTVRSLLWAHSEPHYAGYVAWRGLIPESAVPEEVRSVLLGNFAFANNQGSHILGYLVPGEHNDVTPGRRLYNWVWYRTVSAQTLPALLIDRYGQKRSYSVPEGLLSDTWRRELHIQADTLLPPPFRR